MIVNSLFNKPYPYIGSVKSYFLSNFLIGCFVALFLIVFQPFGTGLWETENKVLKLAGFGLVSFLVPLSINLITQLFVLGGKSEDKWNVGKEILSIVLVICAIALGNLLYSRLLGIVSLTLSAYCNALLTTCLIGIFPVTAHVLLKQRRLQKRNEQEAQKLNEQLKTNEQHFRVPEEIKVTAIHSAPETGKVFPPAAPVETAREEIKAPVPELITLIAENEKDKLVMEAVALIYIASADNYSTVFHLEKLVLKKFLLRGSLKRIEAQISTKNIMRCHRSYIVNLTHVKKVEGNAAGYRLVVGYATESIPVSRNYAPQVLEALRREK